MPQYSCELKPNQLILEGYTEIGLPLKSINLGLADQS